MSINFPNDMALLNKFSFSSKIFKFLKLISNVQFKKIIRNHPHRRDQISQGEGGQFV